MKPSIHLFQLIHSLGKAEKRHFKLFAGRHVLEGGNHYVKLFDKISAQREYNENALKESFNKEPWIRNLPFHKNHLYRLILNSLHVCHMNHSAEAIFKKQLHQAGLLFQRGLNGHCWKLLKTLKKNAIALENSQAAFEANVLIKKLLSQQSYGYSGTEMLTQIITETKQLIIKLENQDAYENLHHRAVRLLFRQSGSKRKAELKKMLSDPLLRNESHALTITGKVMYNTIHAVYHSYAEPDIKRALWHDCRRVELTEKHPGMIAGDPGGYVNGLKNQLISCIKAGYYEDALSTIRKMREFPIRRKIRLSNQLSASIFIQSAIQELTVYINQGRFAMVNEIVVAVETGMKKFSKQITTSNQMELFYTIAYMFWANAEGRKVLRWLNLILHRSKERIRPDLVFYAHLLNYLTRVDMQDQDFLPYILRSVDKHIKNGYVPDESENILLKFMRAFKGSVSGAESRKLILSLRAKLKSMRSPSVENKLSIFSWIESRLSGRPLPVVLSDTSTTN